MATPVVEPTATIRPREGASVGKTAVRLRGGPEDGREVTVSTDTSGKPIPRITLTARVRNTQALAPQLAYERRGCRPDGVWEFHYVGPET